MTPKKLKNSESIRYITVASTQIMRNHVTVFLITVVMVLIGLRFQGKSRFWNFKPVRCIYLQKLIWCITNCSLKRGIFTLNSPHNPLFQLCQYFQSLNLNNYKVLRLNFAEHKSNLQHFYMFYFSRLSFGSALQICKVYQ